MTRADSHGNRRGNDLGSPRVSGVVLAVGVGSGFGQPKATVRLDGERLVDRAVRTLRDGGCDEVLVIDGEVALSVKHARAVSNPQWSKGVGGSIRRGLDYLATTAAPEDVAVVVSVDTPWITAEGVRRVWQRLIEAGAGLDATVATYAGRHGEPMAFRRRAWSQLGDMAGDDDGFTPWFREHGVHSTDVDCTDCGRPDAVQEWADLSIGNPDFLGRLRAGSGSVGTALGVAGQELGAFFTGGREALEETRAEKHRRHVTAQGEPPFGIDMDAGVAYLPASPQPTAAPPSEPPSEPQSEPQSEPLPEPSPQTESQTPSKPQE